MTSKPPCPAHQLSHFPALYHEQALWCLQSRGSRRGVRISLGECSCESDPTGLARMPRERVARTTRMWDFMADVDNRTLGFFENGIGLLKIVIELKCEHYGVCIE